MSRVLLPLVVALLLASASPALAQERLTSDFEIAAMNRILESSSDPFHRFSAHLNLGDLRLARGEMAAARRDYGRALEIAEAEMTRSRERSELRRYARAASYAGLASAKLGRRGTAMRLLEESQRYESDSAGGWNTYASAMTVLGAHDKAVAAARNAVHIAGSVENRRTRDSLDLNIYRYTLASSLARTGADVEAESLLRTIIAELGGREFDSIRKSIVRNEQFEILSSTRGDASAYLSLLNRSQLRLARLYEDSGREEDARATYRSVLRDRMDDPVALAGMARLESGEERQRYFRESFAAAPFSLPLIRQYEQYVGDSGSEHLASPSAEGTGDRVRRAVLEAARGHHHAALALLEPLEAENPGNVTLRYLVARSEIGLGRFEIAKVRIRDLPKNLANELRAVLEREERAGTAIPEILTGDLATQPVQLTERELAGLVRFLSRATLEPEMLERLDSILFVARVSFESAESGAGLTAASAGLIHGTRFRFAAPVTFRGEYEPNLPHTLEFRILGVATEQGEQVLLLEPERILS